MKPPIDVKRNVEATQPKHVTFPAIFSFPSWAPANGDASKKDQHRV